MKIANPQERLARSWGTVDNKHVSLIAEWVSGKRVLDLGCGYGTTTAYLIRERKLDCVGIDNDPDALRVARSLFPYGKYMEANAEKLPFEDGAFDTIVLRDSLHHFYGEAEFEKVKAEIRRVSKKGARLVLFDPNVNLMLKVCRKIMFHKDEECPYEKARSIVSDLGFRPVHESFNTVLSLPLSGGYVGIDFVPNMPIFHRALLKLDRAAEATVAKLAIARHLCWRYIIAGEREA